MGCAIRPGRFFQGAGKRWGLAVLLAGVAAVPPALANDTTAALTTGGLVFTASDDIEMRSEELWISRQRIAVRYRFFNRAASDRTVTVAFPLPEVDALESSNVAVPDAESDNFLGFRTRVDGREVVAAIEQKARLGALDVTDRLKELGVPLLPTSRKAQAALDALPEPVQQRLLRDDLVRPDDYDIGKGMEHHIGPQWSVKTTYHWRQTFPAGRELVIEHAYRPSVGASVQTAVIPDRATSPERRQDYARFCPDGPFIAGVRAATKRNGNVPPSEVRLSYVLSTGANWAGPIGDFRLVVDKGDPGALISFCETGVVKTGPTTFEVRKKTFRPARDLDILIIEVLR
ncbi:conserved exported protein of unknown function [Rhodovastum atsumiense]|uniref:DUF4424 domain-containing protein n=1 Tax=Rhodovastum atsumiense TaxID=504468 RepID=A0A5M6IV00_9PROT|nr:DUF4424 domain-containing protein [Rhodovastum atsumiense]KAA5612134.1 DUF4424 domain-containing protein [Rhodovastum atsumiense]CAH2603923.1 conserved exported protein of unknown function [Rhodovastum atsumiense]